MHILCKNKEEYIRAQHELFEMGFYWNSGGTNIYLPDTSVPWNDGVVIITNEKSKRLLFNRNYGNFDITFESYHHLFCSNVSELKVLKFIEDIFEGDV